MTKKIQGEKTLVTILSSQGASTLTEYVTDGVVYRKYVPTSKLEGNFIQDETLASGIPYGFPWDEIVIKFDPQKFAEAMHNAELWTVEDVLKSPAKLTGVLRKVFEQDFRKILETASSEKRRS